MGRNLLCRFQKSKISELIENIRVLSGFVTYFSRFQSFWSIFDGPKPRKSVNHELSYLCKSLQVLLNENFLKIDHF